MMKSMRSTKAKKISRRTKWLLGNQVRVFPELAALDDLDHRLQVLIAAGRHTRPTLFVMVGLIQPIIILLTRDWFKAVDAKYYFLPITLYFCCFGFLLVTVPFRVHRKQMQRTIRQKINEFGRRVCMECGYRLKGITEPRCPECGQPFSFSELSS